MASTEFGKQHAGDPLGHGVTLYAYVPNLDDYYRRVKAGGARIMDEPKDQYWGDRTMSLVDPQGYLWTFAQHLHVLDPNKIPWQQEPAVAEATATA